MHESWLNFENRWILYRYILLIYHIQVYIQVLYIYIIIRVYIYTYLRNDTRWLLSPGVRCWSRRPFSCIYDCFTLGTNISHLWKIIFPAAFKRVYVSSLECIIWMHLDHLGDDVVIPWDHSQSTAWQPCTDVESHQLDLSYQMNIAPRLLMWAPGMPRLHQVVSTYQKPCGFSPSWPSLSHHRCRAGNLQGLNGAARPTSTRNHCSLTSDTNLGETTIIPDGLNRQTGWWICNPYLWRRLFGDVILAFFGATLGVMYDSVW